MTMFLIAIVAWLLGWLSGVYFESRRVVRIGREIAHARRRRMERLGGRP